MLQWYRRIAQLSYSQGGGSAPLTKKKNKAAVGKVIDKNCLSENVVIHGVEELENEKLQGKVKNSVQEAGHCPPTMSHLLVSSHNVA